MLSAFITAGIVDDSYGFTLLFLSHLTRAKLPLVILQEYSFENKVSLSHLLAFWFRTELYLYHMLCQPLTNRNKYVLNELMILGIWKINIFWGNLKAFTYNLEICEP